MLGPERRGRPRTDIHERVLALFRQGRRPVDVAEALKITKQRVSAILKKAGINVANDKMKANAAMVERVRRESETAPNGKTVAARLGLPLYTVFKCYEKLREQGIRKRRPKK